ncbi:MAG TPA: cyclic nucleotide-binding domain-containing protein [Chitinispirillaceae bacterium]|nr:cyclic nucleotide-binding domain-containing protein [Chitinispirillaceae bacterium]
MGTIPVITSNQHIVDVVSNFIYNDLDEPLKITWLKNSDVALEFMAIDMPELIIVDFCDPGFDGYALLDRITEDNWLINAGIVGFCTSSIEVENLENLRKANLIIALTTSELEEHLHKILTIIFKNRRIIFQHTLSANLINDYQATFVLDNDPYIARCYTNLVCNFVHYTYKIPTEIKFHLKLALIELLLNAMEHGNCEITYDEKTGWMEDGNFDIFELIQKRMQDPAIASRKVHLTFSLSPQQGVFTITDEGKGFDWRNMKDPSREENLLMLHGRGIVMTRSVVSNLTFNEKGNEASFQVLFNNGSEFKMPEIFDNLTYKEITTGDIIFEQGEVSDFLYYIVEGRYSVQANGHQVSVLTPDDIFMGEMSFLLNNRRSASVTAESNGKLIQISKKQFVETIKKHPHYALFLCRLLAQRILRSNQRE